jgi:hypothetical protein
LRNLDQTGSSTAGFDHAGQLQIPIAHPPAALPLVVAKRFELGCKLWLRERFAVVRRAPGLLGRAQLGRCNGRPIGCLKALPDKGSDMGAYFDFGDRRGGSLREGR